MAYFRECPHCGASLDPAEQCECIKEREIKQHLRREREIEISILQEKDYSQPKFQFC